MKPSEILKEIRFLISRGYWNLATSSILYKVHISKVLGALETAIADAEAKDNVL